MKWNDEIRVKKFEARSVYDQYLAEELYERKEYTCKQLSLMKQENIRMALNDKSIHKGSIKATIDMRCGYCFKYLEKEGCIKCPLHKKLKEHCYDIIERMGMMNEPKTRKEFADAHKAWCIKLGLWKKDWV